MRSANGGIPVASIAVAQQLIPESVVGNKCLAHRFCAWPPNLFAFTSTFLDATGCYARITDFNVWGKSFITHPDKVTKLAEDWRGVLASARRHAFQFLNCNDDKVWLAAFHDLTPHEALTVVWDAFTEKMRGSGKPGGDLRLIWDKAHRPVVENLLVLHAAADEVCAGWGIRELDNQPVAAAKKAREWLDAHGTLATIHPDRGRVLPKRHTPPVGTTLRALSTSLCFHRSSIEVK